MDPSLVDRIFRGRDFCLILRVRNRRGTRPRLAVTIYAPWNVGQWPRARSRQVTRKLRQCNSDRRDSRRPSASGFRRTNAVPSARHPPQPPRGPDPVIAQSNRNDNFVTKENIRREKFLARPVRTHRRRSSAHTVKLLFINRSSAARTCTGPCEVCWCRLHIACGCSARAEPLHATVACASVCVCTVSVLFRKNQ